MFFLLLLRGGLSHTEIEESLTMRRSINGEHRDKKRMRDEKPHGRYLLALNTGERECGSISLPTASI